MGIPVTARGGMLAEQLLREIPLILEYAMRSIVSEHQRLSEIEPQARAWQQQEIRGTLLSSGPNSLDPTGGYEHKRNKLRLQFGELRKYFDMKGIQINRDL